MKLPAKDTQVIFKEHILTKDDLDLVNTVLYQRISCLDGDVRSILLLDQHMNEIASVGLHIWDPTDIRAWYTYRPARTNQYVRRAYEKYGDWKEREWYDVGSLEFSKGSPLIVEGLRRQLPTHRDTPLGFASAEWHYRPWGDLGAAFCREPQQ